MTVVAIKQGESLGLTLTFTDDSGAEVDISGLTITGMVRASDDVVVAELPIVITPTLGMATVTVDDTREWPLGLLRSDLRVTSGGQAWLTDTFGIRVNRAVTV